MLTVAREHYQIRLHDIEVGQQWESLGRTVTEADLVNFAGLSGDFNPIHIDDEFARAVGLPGRILHGLWTMAQVARAQTEAAGGPEHLKRLSVQFRGMGMPEQEVVVRGSFVLKSHLLRSTTEGE